jgi:hypothetical protein
MAGGRTGEFEENKPWSTGQKLLARARAEGKAMPILFARAEVVRRGDGTTSEARAGDDRGDPCEDHAEEAPRGPGPIFRGAEEEPTL